MRRGKRILRWLKDLQWDMERFVAFLMVALFVVLVVFFIQWVIGVLYDFLIPLVGVNWAQFGSIAFGFILFFAFFEWYISGVIRV